MRRVHVHLTFPESLEFKQAVALVKLLKESKKLAGEYACLKRKAVRLSKGSGKKYRLLKDGFLERLSKIALKEF